MGESSKVIDLFTRRDGRIPVAVKGAYLPRSPYVSTTHVLTEIQGRLRPGRTFDYLASATPRLQPTALRQDYQALIYGSLLAEVVSKCLHEYQSAPQIFDVLEKALETMNDRPHLAAEIAVATVVKLTCFLGFRPQVKDCVICKAQEATFFYDPVAGGLVCANCRRSASEEATRDDIELLNDFLYTKFDQLKEERKKTTLRRVLSWMIKTLSIHLDLGPIRSLALLP